MENRDGQLTHYTGTGKFIPPFTEQAAATDDATGGPSAGLPMSEALELLRRLGSVDGTLQNGGGGLAIIGATTKSSGSPTG